MPAAASSPGVRSPRMPDRSGTVRGSGRTVVCDLGAVLLRWQPLDLVAEALPEQARAAGGAAGLVSRLFEDFRPDGDWARFDRGTLDLAGVVAGMAARTGLDPADVRTLLDAVPAHLAVQQATAEVFQALRRAGHRLVYLSNMPAPYADVVERLGVFAELFDGGVFSGRVGVSKPEPEIYQVATERLGLDPRRLLLVDDKQANLDAAARLGWSGLRFTDAAACAAELTRLGWLPARR